MNRRTYSRLWVPTLLVALVTILCFAFVSRYQNTQVRQGNELNMQAMAVMRDVEHVLANMMQGVAVGEVRSFVDAARVSRDLEGVIRGLIGSGVPESEDLWVTYRELYRNLVTAVALFHENRTQDAALAMETVRHLENSLRVRLERLAEQVVMNQVRLTRTMNLIMAVAALLLLATAVVNGLFFVPALVVRPMQRMVEKAESAGEALRHSEEHLFAILRSMGDGVIVRDKSGRVTSLNRAAEVLTGWTASEAAGRPLEEVYHIINGLTREAAANPVMHTLNEGVGVELINDILLISRDGTERHLAESCAPIHDALGDVTGAVLVFRDVTEEYMQRQELRNEQLRLEAITGSAHDAIVMMAPDETIVFWNPSAERFFGYSQEEALGKSLHRLIAPERYHALFFKVLPRFQATGQGGAVGRTLELEGRRSDGSEVPIELSLSAMQLSSGWHAVGVIRDITERRQAEEKLQAYALDMELKNVELDKAVVAAEQATRAKSEFLANMSHEIRTPMNGVIGMTGLLLDTPLSEGQRRYAEIVKDSADLLLELINDILDFSKIEAGKLDLETLDFDLQSLLDDFAATMALRAHDKGLELICVADHDVPTALQGDPGRLRQILNNFAGNAVKFSYQGEVVIRVRKADGNAGKLESWNAGIGEADRPARISDSLEQPDLPQADVPAVTSIQQDIHPSIPVYQHTSIHPPQPSTITLLFTVQDTGIGIPEDKIGVLFEKFAQVDASTTRKYGGTGLGLAISKQLVELMGGEVGVTSVEGQGSTFWFTVRFGLQADAAKKELSPPSDLAGVHVLIVDDNATNREILSARFSVWGLRSEETSSGPEGLQALYRSLDVNDPFRLAIIDMQMPGMDGEALGRAIKADGRLKDTQLVMLTSLGARGDARRFQEVGFTAYAVKPIRPGELKAVLSQALATGDGSGTKQPVATRHTARESQHLFLNSKARILLAEDNSTNQKVALALLKNLGLKADAVANGVEVLQALRSIPYDLVLMDVQMPEMDGLEATRRIRAAEDRSKMSDVGDRTADPQDSGFSPHPSHQRLPVIALTAHAMQGDRERFLAAGMDDYVTKPVELFKLAEVLERWLPKGEVRGCPERQGGEACGAPMNNSQEEQSPSDELQAQAIPEEGNTASERIEEDIPAFNKADYLRRIGGNETLAMSILGQAVQELPAMVAALQEVLRQREKKAIQAQAHTLKGTAATVGAAALSELARKIEDAAKNEELDDLGDLEVQVNEQWERFAQAVSESGLTEPGKS
ncbi:PAS domain S-box protein [Desulfonatronum sp. SC1]|uniref:hybrid sensor histidine kinase/response regulator n=1 Tax=Desulfonatronum sp. SC1 TaxID=2109626 RepID=UPI001304E53D|nr:PAS domain S-box protein [Desulfonatronum sp. SC1]